MPITGKMLEFVNECIASDDVHRFYCRKEWRDIRTRVMQLDHYECQKCRSRGKITKHNLMVHHVHHLRDYPELALDIYDSDGNRNLVTLCMSCHEEEHPEERHRWQTKEPLTKERW